MKEKIASFLVKTKKMCVPLPLLCSLGKKIVSNMGGGGNDRNAQSIPLWGKQIGLLATTPG